MSNGNVLFIFGPMYKKRILRYFSMHNGSLIFDYCPVLLYSCVLPEVRLI